MAILCAAMRQPDTVERQKILRLVFSGYNASSDWPGHAFVDDLLDIYPSAKVILNKRTSAPEWEQSVRASLRFFWTRTYLILCLWLSVSRRHHRMYRQYALLAKRRYGIDDIWTTECYEAHNTWVRAVCADKGTEVLEWEPDDGWAPLCKFLGRRVPHQPFPRTNETAEIKKLKAVLIKNGLCHWVGVVLGLFVLDVLWRWSVCLLLDWCQ